MNAADFDRGLWVYRAYVLRIIDGDTFTAMLDLGCFVRFEAHIRIAGFNAPELPTPEGVTARTRLLAELPGGIGWPLRIVSKQRETVFSQVHSFERLVCDVWLLQSDGSLKDLKEALA